MYLCRLELNLMRKTLSKILIPALFLMAAGIQSFGVDFGRASHFRAIQDSLLLSLSADSADVSIDSLSGDSLYRDSIGVGIDSLRDSISVSIDSLRDSIVIDTLAADTVKVINPRDTIQIPAGLDTLDPFKFKYYIAIKDSVTRIQTRDSLLLAGDTLEVQKLDSLYVKDSTEVAQWRWNVKWNSMTRKERKKWTYENVILPRKIHEADSVLARQDSIRARKDSIISATPRILDTYAVPDSMQFKREIAWLHERNFNNIQLQKIDTTYNFYFNDYPFFRNDVNATYLGISGSPTETYNFFKREETDGAYFYTPYQSWSYSPETLLQYNTKAPYTELSYWGTLFATKEKEESNIKVLTSQNILPELNLTLEYSRFGGNGLLRNEDVNNRTAVVALNYLGKRLVSHAGFIFNSIKKSENGGIIDNTWIRDTTVDSREIEVALKEASNTIKKKTVYLDQSYRIPFTFLKNIGKNRISKEEKARRDSIMTSGDSAAIAALNEELAQLELERTEEEAAADTLKDEDVTTAFIGHCSDFSVYTKFYQDQIAANDQAGRAFYNDAFYLNPTRSADSLRVMKLENKAFIRLQPWKEDGIVSKLDVGIGDKLMNYYLFNPDNYFGPMSNTVLNSVYLYAGALGQYKQYFKWDASGKYNFAGYEVNDFSVDANMSFSMYPFRRARKSPLTIDIHFETSLKEPDFYQQHYYSNHYKWENNFSKISTSKLEGYLNIPRWDLSLGFGYSLLSGNIYYDYSGVVRQNTNAMSVMTASLEKNFTLWNFHFDHQVLAQFSSNEEVLPLPKLAVNLRYYFQFNVVKNVMQMQIGANAQYNTLWHAPAYSPALGVFHNQNEELYGNCPYIDAFVNIQWKQACIFVKFINVGMGWPNKSADYFSAHHHIRPQRALKLGIHWPFYVQNKTAAKSSNKKSGGGGASPGGKRSMGR